MSEAWPAARAALAAVGVKAPPEALDAKQQAVYTREGPAQASDLERCLFAYGLERAAAFDAAASRWWQFKLVLPFQVDLDLAQTALVNLSDSADEVGKTVRFETAVNQLAGPVTRLIAIHLYNAFLANGVSVANAKTLPMAAWPATAGFFAGEVPFSLAPLLGAYAPTTLAESYAASLAALATDRLAVVEHSQVREYFAGLLVMLANWQAKGGDRD